MRLLSHLSIAFFLVLLIVAFDGCATEDLFVPVEEDDASTSFFNPKEETLILDEGTNQDIRMFDVESGLLVYDVGSPQLDSIEVGSIIISRPNAEAEGGFLRKVTEVRNDGNRIAMETEPANLPDAFESYRWRLRGDNAGRGRNDEDDAGFSMDDSTIVYVFRDEIPGVPDWEYVLTAEVNYDLNFVSELDYQLFGQGSGISHANLGLDRFYINSVVLQMAFERGSESSIADGLPEDVTFTLEDMGPVFTNLQTLALPRFPVDPPTSLVWIEPIIRIDISEETMSSISLGNRFVFSQKGNEFSGRVVKNGVNDNFRLVHTTPSGMNVSGSVFFNGEYSYTSGISVGLGLAPYSRGLFTLGARATVGPYAKFGGQASIEAFSQDCEGSLVFPAAVNVEAGIAASAGLFLDANFFGLAPANWDVERTLWSKTLPIINWGVDSGCSLFFNNFFGQYDRATNSIAFSTNRIEREGINTDGVYEIYLDGQLLVLDELSTFEPDQSYLFPLPADIEPGEHTLRFVRSVTSGITVCEQRLVITIPDLGMSETCGGIDQVIDTTSNTIYCIQQYGQDLWFGNNLTALVEDDDGNLTRPICPADNPQFCEPYGGLYDYNQLLKITSETSPVSTQGLCPNGYHVPSVREWLDLFGAPADLQPNAVNHYVLEGVAEPFRAASTWGNNDPGEEGINPSANNFNALAAGWYTNSSSSGHSNLGVEAIWWTSTPFDTGAGEEGAYAVIMQENSSTVGIIPLPVTQGNSCRCVAD